MPVDIVKIAHDHGFLVLKTCLPAGTTALLAVDNVPVLGTDSNKVIVVASRLNNEDMRFMIAHCLGHYVLRKEDKLYVHEYE